jgi:hypothetical protein
VIIAVTPVTLLDQFARKVYECPAILAWSVRVGAYGAAEGEGSRCTARPAGELV